MADPHTHIMREDKHLNGGRFGIRVGLKGDQMELYTWKPNIRVDSIVMSREEALELATLIHKQWPLDALCDVVMED